MQPGGHATAARSGVAGVTGRARFVSVRLASRRRRWPPRVRGGPPGARSLPRFPVVPLLLCLLLVPAAAFATGAAERALEAGVEAAERGDNEAALRHYRRARAAGLESAALHHNMGSAYYRLGRYGQARAAFLRAAGYPRMAALAYYNLGRVAAATGDNDEARHWFRRARDAATGDELARKAADRLGVEHRPDETRALYVEVFGGYDSNPRLTGVDDLAARDREGDALVGGLLTGRYLLGGDRRDGSTLFASAYADSHFDLDDQDLALVEGGIARARPLAGWDARYAASASRLWLGGEGLLRVVRGELRAGRALGRRPELDLRLRAEYLSGADGFGYLDGTRAELRTRVGGDHGTWRWQVTHTREHNDRDDLAVASDGDFFSVSPVRDELALDLERYLFGPYTGALGIAFRESRYPDSEERGGSVAGQREDRRLELTLGLSRPLPDLWTLRLETRHRDNESNFDEFDYARTYVTLSLGRTF